MTTILTSMFSFLLVLAMGFFIFIVLPVWLFLHYRKRNHNSTQDLQRLSQLQTHAANLEQRVKVLEMILDAKAPNWRVSR